MHVIRTAALGVTALIAAAIVPAGAALAQPEPSPLPAPPSDAATTTAKPPEKPSGLTISADIQLDEAGVMKVTQDLGVPANGSLHVDVPLRVNAGQGRSRVYAVDNISVEGPAKAEVRGNIFTVTASPGDSTIKYTVRNTVDNAGETQVFGWAGALGNDVASLHVTVMGATPKQGIAGCEIGPAGARKPCANVRVEPDGVLYLDQHNLRAGEEIRLLVALPAGTVAANAVYDEDSSPWPIIAAVIGTVLIAVLAVVVVVWLRRRRSAHVRL